MKISILREDLIFSHWIFVWFVLYFCNIITINPTFIIISGLFIGTLAAYYMWYYNASQYNIIKFVILNMILKNIPLFILWFSNNLIIQLYDIYITLIVFIIYNIYLYINNTNIFKLYEKLLHVYINKTYNKTKIENKSIWSQIYDYIYHKII